MKQMTESELQREILQKYYDLRKEQKVILSPEKFGGKISQKEIWRVSVYLSQKGQIEWTALEWNNTGMGKITAIGIDRIEEFPYSASTSHISQGCEMNEAKP